MSASFHGKAILDVGAPQYIEAMAGLADLLFPSSCVGCGRLARGSLCRECAENIPLLGPEACRICGAPSRFPVLSCKDCRGRRHYFDSARQAVEFSSTIRKAIHNYKYRSERCLADTLALLLADLVDPGFAGVLTWVPSQADRARKRGYDHGELLAKTLGELLGKPVATTLSRARPTQPQMGLEPEVRRRNLVKAFRAKPMPMAEVLVVDDVFTTGATATECARALKAGGASSVHVICVARTIAKAPAGPGGAAMGDNKTGFPSGSVAADRRSRRRGSLRR